jgi:hypothetical protein
MFPEPARRYLDFMGVVERPRDWSFRLRWKGRFRPGLGRPWMACEAWQYNTSLEIARLFRLRIRVAGVIPTIGHDTYLHGHGRLRVRMFDLFPLVDAAGDEYDIGELVTWLDDAVLFAPSMLLGAATRWIPVDERSFEVALTDGGHTVTARVYVDQHGKPLDLETRDRYCADPADARRMIRARWTTPIAGWKSIAGRPVPTVGQAIWHLPQGEFAYADFRVVTGSLEFNVPPRE